MNCLNVSIHAPGRGTILIAPGKIESSRYGVERPSAIAVAYFVVCELLRIRWEEGVLERAFPDDYPAYARHVPRYFPNPFHARS